MIEEIIVQFFVGYLIGVIGEWNEKVMFFLFTGIILFVVIFLLGAESGEIFSNNYLISLLWRLPVFVSGRIIGEDSYKMVFKKTKRMYNE